MTNEQIQSILGAKTVSFNSVFAKATGSVTAAVFLSQAIFWQEKAKFKSESLEIDGEKYFSKTAAEWYDETGLSAEQQKTARVPLVKAGILKEKRAGLPAKMYFRIDIEALVSGISGYLNTGATVYGFSGNRNTEAPRTGNGKFRKQEHGNSGSNYIESLESIESEEERNAGASDPLSSTSETEISNLEAEKQNPIPPVAPAPLSIELHDPETPGVTIYDHIPHKGYPTTEPVGEWQRVNVPQEIEALKTDTSMREAFTLSRKIPSANYAEYLEAFAIDVQGRGEKYTTPKQLRSHFLNWSGTRFEIQSRKAKESKPATPTGQPAKIRQL